MGRFRSMITQSPAIVISILAVALSMGGGAYASTQLGSGHSAAASQASQASQAITTGVSWTSLSLINGWASENATFASGNPKVAQQSGIVYLSGSLHQPTPGSEQFATLPSSFRPAHNMWITVYTVSDTSGTLFIGHDGVMEAFASGTCGSGNTAQCFTSLAGVSFPVNS
jgi:hypothetical protein